jgi:hypothetical protein
LLFDRAEAEPYSLVDWYAEEAEDPNPMNPPPPPDVDSSAHDVSTALAYSAALAQCRTVDVVLDWGNT